MGKKNGENIWHMPGESDETSKNPHFILAGVLQEFEPRSSEEMANWLLYSVTSIVFLLSRGFQYSMFLLRSAMDWSVVCDCGIS